MVLHLRKRVLAGVVAVAALVPAATADARTVDRVFPAAGNLCERVADGRAPKALQGKESLVAKACADLASALAAADTSLDAKLASIQSQADSARAAAQHTCDTGGRQACRTARAQLNATLVTLLFQRLEARIADRQAIGDARTTFWDAIDAIRTGPVPPPDDGGGDDGGGIVIT